MRNGTCWKSVVLVAAVATLLLAAVPADATEGQSADAGACPQVQQCLELLRDGVALLETGRWEAASLVLQGVAAGLEGRPSHARELALAYVYLGVARLQVSDADEARQWFAEAHMRDPTLRLDPAEFPGDVLEIWEEARDLAMLFVDTEPAGAEVSVDGVVRGRSPVGVAGLKPGEYRVTLGYDGYAEVSRVLSVAAGRTERLFVSLVPAPGAVEARRLRAVPLTGLPAGVSASGPSFGDAAVEQAPVNVLPVPARFPAGTIKKSGRSLWRTLAGVLGMAGGVAMMVETSKCIPGGGHVGNGGHDRKGMRVEFQGGILDTFTHNTSKDCTMRYGYYVQIPGGEHGQYSFNGRVQDHELVTSGAYDPLSDPTVTSTQLRTTSPGALAMMEADSSFQERLNQGLVESINTIRLRRRVPKEYLVAGGAMIAAGALLSTIWSHVTVVDDLAVSVTPSGGVLASRSFGW